MEWFQSHITNGQQVVKIARSVSEKQTLSPGVTQGWILGPIVFLLYLYNLPLIIDESEIDLYADDSTFYTSSSNVQNINENLKNNMKRVDGWCKHNNLLGSKEKLKNHKKEHHM